MLFSVLQTRNDLPFTGGHFQTDMNRTPESYTSYPHSIKTGINNPA